ncbi:hypothetical protein, partial [Nocardia sp. NPDC024068]|uniref:hypothetical protein n=1 Tax=Nocardia sp. NPDC024068 TaxID=3157197 RepID=UPI0033E881A9
RMWRSHESRGLTADASGAEPRARQRANKHSTFAGKVTCPTFAGKVTCPTFAGKVTCPTFAGKVTRPTFAVKTNPHLRGRGHFLTFAGKPA